MRKISGDTGGVDDIVRASSSTRGLSFSRRDRGYGRISDLDHRTLGLRRRKTYLSNATRGTSNNYGKVRGIVPVALGCMRGIRRGLTGLDHFDRGNGRWGRGKLRSGSPVLVRDEQRTISQILRYEEFRMMKFGV